MALFYCYRRLIPRFSYTQCHTIPYKAISIIAQTVLEQKILYADALILTTLYGISVCKYSGEITDIEGILLLLSSAGMYQGLSNAATVIPICRSVKRLYKNEIFMIQNLK
jgi:hypothetical protein